MDQTTKMQDETLSWSEFLSGPYRSSLALVCMAVWLHAADSLIVATMLPSIIAEVGGAELVAWSITLYLTASIVAGAGSALVTIRYGLKRPMSVAAAIFGVGCLLSALAPNMQVVLAGRVLQGLGGGALVSMGFIATRQVFPPAAIPRAMAAVSTLWGASAFLGPLLGGGFVEYATWRWGFAAFGTQAVLLAFWISSRQLVSIKFDVAASIFPWRRLGLICLAVLLIGSAGINFTPMKAVIAGALGAACFLLFLWLDDRSGTSRMLPQRPFDIRHRTGAALLMLVCFNAATITNGVFGSLFLTSIYGVSALTAGYILACSAIGWTAAAFLVSGAKERFDGFFISVGAVVITASIGAFAYVYPIGPLWLISVISFLGGSGFGMAWTFILRRATSALEDENEVQRISSAISTVQRIGYAFGAAYVGVVANILGFNNEIPISEVKLIARWLFIACLPIAFIGFFALIGFVQHSAPIGAQDGTSGRTSKI